jgi:hypothetical protein
MGEFTASISNNLIAAAIFSTLGFLASRAWTLYTKHFSKEYSKLTYYRVIRLRFKERGDPPYYIRHHHTVKDRSDEVFDETWALNGIQSSKREKLAPVRLTSSGVVDAVQIVPVLDGNADNHPHTRDKVGNFIFSHPEPSTQLAAVGTLVNGLQTKDNWWFATTAEYDGQTLVLIADFTSLPYEICPITEVTSVLERNKIVVPKEAISQQLFEDHLGVDLFYLRLKDARKGDTIRFTFTINKDAIPRPKK